MPQIMPFFLTLNFLNVDAHEQSAEDRFWHYGTKVTFGKVKWKDPCTGLWKGPKPVLIWAWGYICICSQKDVEIQWLPESLIWCVQQKSDSSVGTLESEWGAWICVPDFLTTSCCSMRRKGRLWWQLVAPRFLVDLLHKFLYLSVFCLFWSQSKNTDWMLNSLSTLYLGIQNSFLPVCYSICCWNKGPGNWDLRKFSPEGKRLIKAMDHYYGGKEWLSPLWEMRRGP